MYICKEKEKDYLYVYDVIKKAFEHAEHSDGTEQDLVLKLRKSPAFVPELSLVAKDEEEIVGHILFTKVKVGEHIALALAPLSVLPEYQQKGIGSKLIEEGHRIATKLGYSYSIVLGSDKFYTKFGYKPAIDFGILAPFAVPKELFMALKLKKDAPKIRGVVEYPEEFGV